MGIRVGIALACALSLTMVPEARAEEGSGRSSEVGHIRLRAWGVRAGIGIDPDQAIGGFHWYLGEFVRNLRFQPDVELGVGDDLVTVFATAPVHYVFRVDSNVTPYAGGGIAIGVVNRDRPEQAGGDDTSFEAGARIIGGLQWPRKNGKPFAVEANLGLSDVHDAQVKVTWTF